jgi:hypothetical protein
MSTYSVFNYVQSTPATSWTINHNLGSAVLCDVIIPDENGTYVKILPLAVKHNSNSQLVIEFSTAVTGKARLIGIGADFVLLSGAGSIDPGQGA